MNSSNNHRRVLGVFSLAMITAVSVDSIRNLPATALFGSSLLFFFVLAAVFFLLPSALISAELSSTSDADGGVYTWIKTAFGSQAGFIAVWFQWIENVIWYPTILSFVGGTIAYLISPSLVESKYFLMTVIVCAFWGATIINLYGIKSSALFSNICALFGLILPMILIISLGVAWIVKGNPIQIHFNNVGNWMPHLNNPHVWISLTAIILSFCGMEIATVHSSDVKNPQHAYPRAMMIAVVLIVFTLLSGAFSIAIVIPEAKISLVAGIMQAFNAFFSAYHMRWILPVIAVMLVLGGMGSVSNWIIAPTRGLLIAAQDGNMPKHMRRENSKGAPSVLLIYQAIIVTIISASFLLMPTVNGSYWLLTALAAQLYMIMYIMMFVAAIRLRYKKHAAHEGFRIPWGNTGMWIVAGAGILGASITFIAGFIPPDNISVGSVFHYESLLLIGLVTMSLPPFVLYGISRFRAH